mmetsp:Transcript_47294/g.137702  ORF Transcript_47294/g.137702 Transcript_47294/m.137702 type:complete len:235 (+) Transcript_47294:867-1571(+)
MPGRRHRFGADGRLPWLARAGRLRAPHRAAVAVPPSGTRPPAHPLARCGRQGSAGHAPRHRFGRRAGGGLRHVSIPRELLSRVGGRGLAAWRRRHDVAGDAHAPRIGVRAGDRQHRSRDLVDPDAVPARRARVRRDLNAPLSDATVPGDGEGAELLCSRRPRVVRRVPRRRGARATRRAGARHAGGGAAPRLAAHGSGRARRARHAGNQQAQLRRGWRRARRFCCECIEGPCPP